MDKEVEKLNEMLESAEAEEELTKIKDNSAEAVIKEEAEGVEIPEGVKEEEPKAEEGEVKSEEVLEEPVKAEDVEPVKVEEVKEEVPEDKEYKAACAVAATGGEDSPLACNCDKCKEYHSLKEAIKLGTAEFDTDEKKAKLSESIAILLANEADDLLYEEYNRCLAESKALRDRIVTKYGPVSMERTEVAMAAPDFLSTFDTAVGTPVW